ncbi:hypothetical protein [Micromonospora sp. NPDC005299]
MTFRLLKLTEAGEVTAWIGVLAAHPAPAARRVDVRFPSRLAC